MKSQIEKPTLTAFTDACFMRVAEGAYQTDRAQDKAEALRQPVLALMKAPERPEYAHPFYWAPFVVVGEGGAGATRKESGLRVSQRIALENRTDSGLGNQCGL